MSTLLMCHCYRMVRIAQRMRNGEWEPDPSAQGFGGGGRAAVKRGAPPHVVEALPVLRFGDRAARRELAERCKQQRAAAQAEAEGQAGGAATRPIQALEAAAAGDGGVTGAAAQRPQASSACVDLVEGDDRASSADQAAREQGGGGSGDASCRSGGGGGDRRVLFGESDTAVDVEGPEACAIW